MSETTEPKSVEEIAREDGIPFVAEFYDCSIAKDLVEAVRRSDRQHWLEVALNIVEGRSKDFAIVRDRAYQDGRYEAAERRNYQVYLCDSIIAKIRSAFTAQEKP